AGDTQEIELPVHPERKSAAVITLDVRLAEIDRLLEAHRAAGANDHAIGSVDEFVEAVRAVGNPAQLLGELLRTGRSRQLALHRCEAFDQVRAQALEVLGGDTRFGLYHT